MKTVPRWMINQESRKQGIIGPDITKKGITFTYTWKRPNGTKLQVSGLNRNISSVGFKMLAKELKLI